MVWVPALADNVSLDVAAEKGAQVSWGSPSPCEIPGVKEMGGSWKGRLGVWLGGVVWGHRHTRKGKWEDEDGWLPGLLPVQQLCPLPQGLSQLVPIQGKNLRFLFTVKENFFFEMSSGIHSCFSLCLSPSAGVVNHKKIRNHLNH